MHEPLSKIHVYQTSIGRIVWAMTPEFEAQLWEIFQLYADFEDFDATRYARQVAGLSAGSSKNGIDRS